MGGTNVATSLKPLFTVDELRKCFFQKTTDRKNLFLSLARNKRFIEATAQALFGHLDVNKNGYLDFEEMKGVFDVIIRRAAELVMGFSWGIGLFVKQQSKKIFRKKILPFSSKQEGADIFNLTVLIRNSFLYCAGGNSKYDIDDISRYFYGIRSINYNLVSKSQIPTGITVVPEIPEIERTPSAGITVSDEFPEAVTSGTSSVSNGDSHTSQLASCTMRTRARQGSEQIREVLHELAGRSLLA